MEKFYQLLVSTIAAICPILVLQINRNASPKTDYQKLQFEKLLVPLIKLYKQYELAKIDGTEFIKELSELYMSSFQYAPKRLEELIVSTIRSSKLNPKLRNEVEYFYDAARKKLMIVDDYRNRKEETIQSLIMFFEFFIMLFIPALLIITWVPSLKLNTALFFTALGYGLVYLVTRLVNRYKNAKNNRNKAD